jgi:acyl dehydratase
VSVDATLDAFADAVLNERFAGPDPVNVPMIRHWVEAMGLDGAIHLDEEAARASGRAAVVAPAAMTQAWVMRGYAATVDPVPQPGRQSELLAALDDLGYTSVVATDSDFEFVRELVPGDRVSVEERLESVSPEKQTALGPGRFVTTVKTYTDDRGAVVATQRWRTLRFRPAARGHEHVHGEQ